MARILSICTRCPYPPTDGAKLRVYNVSKLLAKEHTVDLLIADEERGKLELPSELTEEFNNVIAFTHPQLHRYVNGSVGFVLRHPIRPAYYSFGDVHDWVDRHEAEYDLIFCNYINTAEYGRHVETTTALDYVDALSEYHFQRNNHVQDIDPIRRKIYQLEGSRLQRYERRMAAEFDCHFITTEADRTVILGTGMIAEALTVLPNGVDDHQIKRQESLDDDEKRIVYYGKMDYYPNVDAVKYFTSEIFPQVIQEHPEAHFLIVGADPSDEVKRLAAEEQVTVTGFVEDPMEYLTQAHVVVAPLRFGTGIQNKILESMALSKPVVTTTLGSEGIDVVDGTHLYVTDRPDEFAQDVSTLLADEKKRVRIGNHARELIDEHYRWNVIGSELLSVIDETLRHTKERSEKEQHASSRQSVERT